MILYIALADSTSEISFFKHCRVSAIWKIITRDLFDINAVAKTVFWIYLRVDLGLVILDKNTLYLAGLARRLKCLKYPISEWKHCRCRWLPSLVVSGWFPECCWGRSEVILKTAFYTATSVWNCKWRKRLRLLLWNPDPNGDQRRRVILSLLREFLCSWTRLFGYGSTFTWKTSPGEFQKLILDPNLHVWKVVCSLSVVLGYRVLWFDVVCIKISYHNTLWRRKPERQDKTSQYTEKLSLECQLLKKNTAVWIPQTWSALPWKQYHKITDWHRPRT